MFYHGFALACFLAGVVGFGWGGGMGWGGDVHVPCTCALARVKAQKRNCPKTCGRETDFKMYFVEHVVISQ